MLLFLFFLQGSNPTGIFGGGIEGDSSVPIETENLSFGSIVAGSRSTFGITEDGELYATGSNESGQLGLGMKDSMTFFTKVPVKFKVKQVACGWAHSMVLSEDGRVFVCGDNKKGQLGLISEVCVCCFTEIDVCDKVTQVACGLMSSFAVLKSGNVMFWGQFRSIKSELCSAPTTLDNSGIVVKIAVGHRHILTLSSSGKVKGFGCNNYGQIGFDFDKQSTKNRVINILAGWNHSIIQLESQQLILFGKNDQNQLAHPDKTCHTNILDFNDESILNLATGSDHIVLQTSKRLLVWGWNEHGILGQNHTKQLYGPPQELNFNVNIIKRIFCGQVSCFIITK